MSGDGRVAFTNATTHANNGTNNGVVGPAWCHGMDYRYDIAPAVIYCLCCAVGVIYTFFGYRLYRISLAATGFIFTTFLVYITCTQHASHLVIGVTIAISIGLGILGAIVSGFLQRIGQFLVGSQIGIAVACVLFVVIEQLTTPPSLWIPMGVLIALWLTFGSLTLKYQKRLLIVGTAVLGSALMVACLDYFIEKSSAVSYIYDALRARSNATVYCWYSWLVLACWPFTCVIGLIIQLRVTGYTYDHVAVGRESKQRKVQKLNLQKLRSEAQQDRQQSHYRHLYQVRRVHGDVISQTFMKNVQEHQEKQKSYTPPPSALTAPDTTPWMDSNQTTLSHVP